MSPRRIAITSTNMLVVCLYPNFRTNNRTSLVVLRNHANPVRLGLEQSILCPHRLRRVHHAHAEDVLAENLLRKSLRACISTEQLPGTVRDPRIGLLKIKLM